MSQRRRCAVRSRDFPRKGEPCGARKGDLAQRAGSSGGGLIPLRPPPLVTGIQPGMGDLAGDARRGVRVPEPEAAEKRVAVVAEAAQRRKLLQLVGVAAS